nr:DUF5995 family protein [uncultured Microscilla sp.]
MGIAAAEVSKGHRIDDLKTDFNKINEVLSSLVHEVQDDLADIWPTFRWLLKITGKVDELVTDFSMQLARNGAWKFALSLALLPDSEWGSAIDARDKNIADKARIVSSPGLVLKVFFGMARLGEQGSVGQKIMKLQQ